ncbi:T9SS type B sorting domain-containing protein [Sediminicola luteus]|uniref:T9SS type B sorting domain-containing protein n=1 Tax=Sediminicola luteus TaxID=319238 RepID=A0ABV2TW63_9FLAO
MFNSALLLLFFLFLNGINAQITLTNNIGTTPIETDMYSCERDEGWSRVFTLSDFGIASNEQFVINSGQVALSRSNNGAYLQFSVFSIDENFPEFFYSLYPRTLLGTRGIGRAPVVNGAPVIVEAQFDEPIIVPAGTRRILVTVKKIEDFYNPESSQVFIAGTAEDTGLSWYEGCEGNNSLTPTSELTIPVPDANFYINVTGEVFNTQSSGSITRLSHNVCDDIIETRIHSCSSSHIYWARDFYLEDFGISTNEEFFITSGQVGINKVGWLPEISFNIYEIDENFPSSFSEANLIGSSQYQELSPVIGENSQIINVVFDTPIVVPAGVKRILVEVHKGIVYGDGLAFIAGSTQDTGVSWQRRCTRIAGGQDFGFDEYVDTADFGRPEANFYINVTGNVNHVTNDFSMNILNDCSDFLKEFSIAPTSNLTSILWNFGDPASGTNNTSTDLSPFHDFSVDGTYTISATITANDGSTELITETINVKDPPNAYGIENIYACENSFNTGISSSFEVAHVTQQVLGGQNNMKVTFIDGSGREYATLPNPFTNTFRDRETIMVRVAHNNNVCCYSETTFDLIVNPISDLSSVSDLFVCSNDANGFATFDLEQVQNDILAGSNAISVTFYRENGNQIQQPLNAVINEVINEEEITVRAFDSGNTCLNETTFKLMVNPLPVVHDLDILIGCDDNGDGISEYFDTSSIESLVLGNQMNTSISYFDSNGNSLPNPLPNPYTNTTLNEETIIVRVTNSQTNCYEETPLVFRTSSQPQLNSPQPVFACNLGSGFANFDLSHIESEIVGDQVGLNFIYSDANGDELPSPLSPFFENTEPWNQTVFVRVENSLNSLCYAETSIDLLVIELPVTKLEPAYYLCHLEPSLPIEVENDFDFYSWAYEDNSIISNTYRVDLIHAGSYTLTIGKNIYGIYCENTLDFEFIKSSSPSITEVRHSRLSEINFIEIMATGDGNFEYSLDGVNFQESNYFSDIPGGKYTAMVKDKDGCGEDTEDVTLIDYPRFFTPNSDGRNDYWHIMGIVSYPNSRTFIFDRYGKLLAELSSDDIGWDGFYKGREVSSNDYWFKTNLGDGVIFSGHFTLKR